jgi:ketosteroid isomerase-like protein
MQLERILVFTVCLIALPLGACSLSEESSETVQPAIETPDMNAYWAAHVAHRQSGDLEGAISILAEDCVLFEPFQPPVSGLQTIAAKMKEALEMAEIHKVSLDSQEVYHHGGWLVDFGTFSETVSFKGKEEHHVLEGSYAAVLEQDADGNWKVKRFMSLPSKPPPPTESRRPSFRARASKPGYSKTHSSSRPTKPTERPGHWRRIARSLTQRE